jgi:hypothetical protein
VEGLQIIRGGLLGLGGGLAVLGVRGSGRYVPPAELSDHGEDFGGDVGQRYDVVGSAVLDHVLDGLRLHRPRLGQLELLAVGASQRHHLHLLLPGRRRVRHRSDRRKERVVVAVVRRGFRCKTLGERREVMGGNGKGGGFICRCWPCGRVEESRNSGKRDGHATYWIIFGPSTSWNLERWVLLAGLEARTSWDICL